MKPDIGWGTVEYNGVPFVVVSYRRPPTHPGLTAGRDSLANRPLHPIEASGPLPATPSLDKRPRPGSAVVPLAPGLNNSSPNVAQPPKGGTLGRRPLYIPAHR